MNNRLFIVTITFLIITFTTSNAWGFWYDLKSPYPITITKKNTSTKNVFECGTPPLPPQNLNFTSKYSSSDPHKSIISPTEYKTYLSQTKDVNNFERQISKWLENFYKKHERQNITCMTDWLYEWAINDAFLLSKASGQGEAVRKWHLATIASHYIQIKDLGMMDNYKKSMIENWLNQLAHQVINDYPLNSSRLSRNNNHQYWAAWSVMITGVALNDRKFYNFGIQNYKKAMKQITINGALPHELRRKDKAFHYHLFATLPLVMMAETAHKNGLNLYKYKNNGLKKLVNFNLDNLENNQEPIRALTNEEQNLDRTVTSGQLSWLIPYHIKYNDERAQKWIKKLSPMRQKRIGGNLSLIYSE